MTAQHDSGPTGTSSHGDPGREEPARDPGAELAATLGLDGRGRGGWLRRHRVAVASLGVLALLLGFWLAYGGTGGESVSYLTEPARRGPLIVTVTATGTVEPTNSIEISSELSGIVRSVVVDFNDSVAVGQALAELDTEKLEAEVAHARATLAAKRAKVAEARATVNEARRDYERTGPLAQKGYATGAALDAARAGYERSRAALQVAEADVEVAGAELLIDETNLRKACICSPIDGVVLSRTVEPGQTVASSLQAPVLFTLAEDLASMQLEVDIDEADVGKVREGQEASFTVEAYQDRRFEARLIELRYAPKAVEGVVTYTAVLALDNSELLLRPGMTATAEVVVERLDDALLIPNAALRFAPPERTAEAEERSLLQRMLPHPPADVEVPRVAAGPGGTRRVWRLSGGAPEAIEVIVGASDGSWTAVLEGQLQAGDALVVDSVAAR